MEPSLSVSLMQRALDHCPALKYVLCEKEDYLTCPEPQQSTKSLSLFVRASGVMKMLTRGTFCASLGISLQFVNG